VYTVALGGERICPPIKSIFAAYQSLRVGLKRFKKRRESQLATQMELRWNAYAMAQNKKIGAQTIIHVAIVLSSRASFMFLAVTLSLVPTVVAKSEAVNAIGLKERITNLLVEQTE
jgi:hypothetical protein